MYEEVVKVFERLQGELSTQKRRCKELDAWVRPDLEYGFTLPSRASKEHRLLRELSRTPWLRLIVDNLAQAMYIDGIRNEEGSVRELWDIWNRNSMNSRQIGIHRTAFTYGVCYALVTDSGAEQTPAIKLFSPAKMAAEFQDLSDTIHPTAALEEITEGTQWRLWLPGVMYVIEQVSDEYQHGMAGKQITEEVLLPSLRLPIVRFANQLDLDGRTIGEIEAFIPSARRINKTAYDRLLAQHFNSWKVRTATGLEIPEEKDEDGYPIPGTSDMAAADRMRIKLAQEDILVGEEGTVFGTLDNTDLNPFVESWRADIEALAAASQTPAYALTGQLVNLSAEALAAARAPLTQKVFERQTTFGDSYAALMRMAASIAGLDDLENDSMLRMHWRDMEIRSLSQAADALGKIAQMLGVPQEKLWAMLPGISSTDVEEWKIAAEEALRQELQYDSTYQISQAHLTSAIADLPGED